VLLLALVAGSAFAAHRLFTTAENRYIREALPLRTAALDLTLQLVDQQAGVRGYIITGAPASLQPYQQARVHAQTDLAKLTAGIGRHPGLAPQVAVVRRRIATIDRYFQAQISRVRSGPAGRAEAERNILAGKEGFDRFRRAAAVLRSEINGIVARATAKQDRTYHRTLTFLLAAGVAAAAIGVALLIYLPRSLEALYRREQRARTEAERGARAARALTHVGDAVILLDPLDRIAYWNRAAEPLLGQRQHDVLGRLACDVLPGFDAVERAAGRRAELVPLTIAGEERWYGVSQTTFPEGRVLVLRDATEAQALERARSDFVATAAHELRTPIAAIYGAARTLRRRDIELAPATEEQFLGVIESESDRLNRIVGQILTTAQLDRGELSITSAACDLRALCEDVVRSLEIAKPDSITFSLDAPDALAPVDSDAERLRQVLTNLVGNAVKYSPDGGNVTVRIVDGLERVRIEVRDEGLGIPRSQQSRIFDKFYRLDPSLSRGVGGSGLGLYICRELIEQMGGSISVSSRPKAGSTFTVELPRRR